jgi:hypothetical protein
MGAHWRPADFCGWDGNKRGGADLENRGRADLHLLMGGNEWKRVPCCCCCCSCSGCGTAASSIHAHQVLRPSPSSNENHDQVQSFRLLNFLHSGLKTSFCSRYPTSIYTSVEHDNIDNCCVYICKCNAGLKLYTYCHEIWLLALYYFVI